MADTTLIDEAFDEALRALDHLSATLDEMDLRSNFLQDEIGDRLAPAAPGANLLTWPHHLVGTL